MKKLSLTSIALCAALLSGCAFSPFGPTGNSTRSSMAQPIAAQLADVGGKARGLKDHGLDEVTSTRALVYAANLIAAGLEPIAACRFSTAGITNCFSEVIAA